MATNTVFSKDLTRDYIGKWTQIKNTDDDKIGGRITGIKHISPTETEVRFDVFGNKVKVVLTGDQHVLIDLSE